MTAIRLSIAERVLDTGLCLLAVQNPRVQTYACVVSLEVRPGDEPAEKSGLANLMGECLDEGTKHYGALELASAAETALPIWMIAAAAPPLPRPRA